MIKNHPEVSTPTSKLKVVVLEFCMRQIHQDHGISEETKDLTELITYTSCIHERTLKQV
jgi:hypothetical protein